MVYHAGTTVGSDGRILTSGGRVLSVTGLGDSLTQAVSLAYSLLPGPQNLPSMSHFFINVFSS